MKNRMQIATIGLSISVVILSFAAGMTGCTRRNAESKTEAALSQVLVNADDIVRVETRRLASGVAFTGELNPIQIVEITARFDGDLDQVLVREGQKVRRDQALAVYHPRDVKDRLQATEAAVLAAQANLRAAENAERRARKLFDAGAAAPSDLEVAEAQRSAAKAALDNAEAVRNRVQEDAERLDVPSPIAGWVSKVHVHGGDRTGVGDRLLTLVKTDTLELSATVPSEALARVQPGTPIRFLLEAYPGEVFEGKVARVNPTTEPGTRQVRIYMRLPNPDGHLVGGLFASGRVIDLMKEEAVSAPVSVLRKEGQEQVVYRVHQGKAERLPVQIGLVDEEAGIAELLGKVTPGDSLLTGVLPGLRDGVRIQILSGGGTEGASSGTRTSSAR